MLIDGCSKHNRQGLGVPHWGPLAGDHLLAAERNDRDSCPACLPTQAKDLAADASTLWGRQYQLRRQLIPSFINSQLADVIFKAGKSINFLRC